MLFEPKAPSAVGENHQFSNQQIERRAAESGATVAGRIPYDPAVTAAQRQGVPVVEYGDSPAAQALAQLWKTLAATLG